MSKAIPKKAARRAGKLGGIKRASVAIVLDSRTDSFPRNDTRVEDDFAETFKAARGKVDPDLKLGF
jgi:hypothetical protein